MPCIGTMNRSVGRHLFGVPPSGGPYRLKPGLQTPNGRFMESPHDFDAVHWDHEPFRGTPLVWSPAFRRSVPAKAGTPNERFSPDAILARIGTLNRSSRRKEAHFS